MYESVQTSLGNNTFVVEITVNIPLLSGSPACSLVTLLIMTLYLFIKFKPCGISSTGIYPVPPLEKSFISCGSLVPLSKDERPNGFREPTTSDTVLSFCEITLCIIDIASLYLTKTGNSFNVLVSVETTES